MDAREVYDIVTRLEDKIDRKFSELWEHLGDRDRDCRDTHIPITASLAVLNDAKKEAMNQATRRATLVSVIIGAIIGLGEILVAIFWRH